MAAEDQIARKYGIDPRIFRALIRQESGGNQAARSPAGAIGKTQLMPATARALGVNPYNERENLEGGAKYLAQQLKRFGGDYRKALAAYNAGPGAVQKYGGVPPYKETQNYVAAILGGKTPKAAGATGAGGSRSTGSTTTSTTPGVDNSQLRQTLLAQYLLQDRGKPDALMGLAAQLQQAQDVPGSVTTSRTNGSTSAGPSGAPKHMSQLLELFYQGPGGIDVKNGQKVPQGFVSGHTEHVHVAAGPKTVVELGKMAQRMGLNVGENSHFNGGHRETSGHAPNSYHYRDQAIDVSGPPDLMRKFARRVANLYHIH